MINENNEDKMQQNLDEMSIYIDWAAILMRDLIEGFLQPLAHDCNGRSYSTMTLIWSEAEAMGEKAEMVNRFLSHVADHHRAISALMVAKDAQDHSTITNTERLQEITGDIEKAVELIAKRPDWLENMKHLNAVAWEIATADTTTTT